MPAEISAPNRAKVVDLYQGGLTLTKIGQSLGLARNTVAKIVREDDPQNAPTRKTLSAADLTPNELFKLRYFLKRQVGEGLCPECGAQFGFLPNDAKVVCLGCDCTIVLKRPA